MVCLSVCLSVCGEKNLDDLAFILKRCLGVESAFGKGWSRGGESVVIKLRPRAFIMKFVCLSAENFLDKLSWAK